MLQCEGKQYFATGAKSVVASRLSGRPPANYREQHEDRDRCPQHLIEADARSSTPALAHIDAGQARAALYAIETQDLAVTALKQLVENPKNPEALAHAERFLQNVADYPAVIARLTARATPASTFSRG